MKEPLIEIFSSVQGEGKYVGARHLFCRFPGCNLACRYCDTDHKGSYKACRIETGANTETYREVANPLEPVEVATYIRMLAKETRHHAVSFTGGEPLLHTAFLAELIPAIRDCGQMFLETNGTLAAELGAVIDDIDIISMDIKMPGLVGRELWREHEAFLKIAKKKDLIVKVVVSGETTDGELLDAVNLVKKEAPDAFFVLQPVTPYGDVGPIATGRLLRLQSLALRELDDVRVIAQTHRILNLA